MSLIDMRTMFFIIMIVTAMVTLFLGISWRQNASRYGGINFFVGDFLLQTIGEFLISFRGFIPDLFSIIISNTLIIAASILGYIGLEYYLNKKTGHKFNIFLIITFVATITYFTFVDPNLGVRSLMIGVFWLINNIRSLYLMIYRAEKSTLSFTKPLIYSYALFMCLSSSRIIEFFINRNVSTEYFNSGSFEKFILFFILIVVISLTYGINLSLNKRLVSEIKKQEKKYSKIFNSSSSAIIITSLKEGKIIEVNNGFRDILGYDDKDIIGNTTEELELWYKKSDRGKFIDELNISRKVRNWEMKFYKSNGHIITGVMDADILDINGEEVVLSIVNDITERKAMEEKIVELSNRDPLTNVYNRRYIFSKLETMLEDYKSGREGFAVALMDIDHFKSVNDIYGHQAGDAALIHFTQTINSMLGKNDFLARYGGEEFIVVSFGLDKIKAADVIENILKTIRSSKVCYEDKEIRYTFSAGIADIFEDSAKSLEIEAIINQADFKLYEAKKKGRDQIRY